MEMKSTPVEYHPSDDGPWHGFINPSSVYGILLRPLFYIMFMPFTTVFAKPGGLVDPVIKLAFNLIPGTIPEDRTVVGLAALYIFAAIALFQTFKDQMYVKGLRNSSRITHNPPREHVQELYGYPYLIHTAFHGIAKEFPLWAVAAILTQMLDPTNQAAVNLLALSAGLKLFVYYPLFIFQVEALGAMHEMARLMSISAVLNLLWKLATDFKGFTVNGRTFHL